MLDLGNEQMGVKKAKNNSCNKSGQKGNYLFFSF